MASDTRLLSGWGRTAPTRATVHAASSLDDVVATVAGAGTRGVVARGLGRSYGDAAQNAGGDVVECIALDRILAIDVEKGLVTTEAGVSLDTLLRVLLPMGWFPMVVPGTGHVTVGGAIASDIHGKFRHGSFADYVERLQIVTPAHGVTTLDPNDDADAFWATAGGMGLTGVVTQATLRLQPVETSRIVCDTERAVDLDDCMARMADGDARYQYSVAWIDCVASGRRLGRSVLTRGNHAPLDQMGTRRERGAREYAPRALLSAPSFVPNGVLNPITVRAFNELWFRKAPRARRDEIQRLDAFFFPLDGVRGWNHIYGSRGFVQYQFVVPYGEERTVRAVLERLASARVASFLAVLKRFEHDSRSMIGFPMPGWTLALDIPARAGALDDLLDALDVLVAEAGGRVYLTKDARLRPDVLAAMYPGLRRWRTARAALDPEHRLHSDMERRLDLTGAARSRS